MTFSFRPNDLSDDSEEPGDEDPDDTVRLYSGLEDANDVEMDGVRQESIPGG